MSKASLKGLFSGGKSNPIKMFADLPKIQNAIQKSLDEFSEIKLKKEFLDGLIEITSKGDKIYDLNFSDNLIKLLTEDKEMAQDSIVASISSMNAYINEERMKKIENDAKSSGLNPDLVNKVFNNDLLSSLM